MTKRLFTNILSTLILLLILLSNITIAQDNCSNSIDGPVYFIETCQTNLILRNEEPAFIGYFLKGMGDVDSGYFSILLPYNVVKEDAQLQRVYDVYYDPSATDITVYNFSVSNDSLTYGALIPIEPFFFNRTPNKVTNWGALGFQEKNGEYRELIRITFNVSANAKAGDYPVYATLLYNDGNAWYKETLESNIHVKAWYEEEYVQVLFILATVLAIFSSSVSLKPTVLNILSRFWFSMVSLYRKIISKRKTKIKNK